MLIVFEGIDGTGKSSHAKRLASYFSSLGREVVLSHEPTNGPWGRKLRESAATVRLDAEQELEYFLRDRQEHVEQLIRPSLAEGKVVILDRYYFSTMAYQGLRGFDPADIRARNEAFAPVPDLLIVLDLDVDIALQRIAGRGDQANLFEKRDALERIRETFLGLRDEPFVRIIDASQTMDDIAAQIVDCFDSSK
ncbi:MAG: dTMP kinase [Verrucomicrobia bacterium]|nr:MAG: dTMP kinase [Verrucomicrobiota bacterium]